VLTPVILATQEAEVRKIEFQNQPRQTVLKTLSQKKKKKNSTNRANGVTQVVEHPPSKCEVLSSNPTIKKKKIQSGYQGNKKESNREESIKPKLFLDQFIKTNKNYKIFIKFSIKCLNIIKINKSLARLTKE
jgi:hypothetical protein